MKSVNSESLARVEKALNQLRHGKMIILTDDEDRENEGDLVLAAEKVTPDAINFMATHARGLICLSLTEERVRRLRLPLMVTDNTSPFSTAFTVSIEAARGVTTGISARDRAVTIKAAVARDARPADLVRPGHVFPLAARPGGVLVRTGQTEGSVDLCRMAGLEPAGVICEVMNADGTMARRKELVRFAKRHNLLMLSVADVVRYRLEREPLVRRVSETAPSIEGAQYRAVAYTSDVDAHTHVALVMGNPRPNRPTLVRVHAACFMGDVLGAQICDCGQLLRQSLRQISEAGEGVLVYLDKEPPPGGKLACTHATRTATLEDQQRELGIGAQILRDVGVGKLRLLSNSGRRISGLEGFGLHVVDRVAIAGSRKAKRAS